MALSFVEYTADGVDTQFTVTFPFIARSHVAVTIDGVDDATFTFINDGLIQPTNTPANGEKVRIIRTTPTGATALTDFIDGSTLVEADVDRVLQQAMYVAEESQDDAVGALQVDVTDASVWDALSRKIVDLLDPTADQDAATKTYVDTKTAADVVAAAASATAAAVSETNAAADEVSTAADAVATAADLVLTAADVVLTNADVVLTGVDAGTASTDAAAAAASALLAVGNTAGFNFDFDSTIAMADPGSGSVRFNHGTLASVTALAFDALSADAGNPDVSTFLTTWDDSTTTALRGTLTIRKVGTPATFVTFSVTGAVVDNTGWLQVPVAFVTSNGTFSASDKLAVYFARTGNKGQDGSGSGDLSGPGSATDLNVSRYDGTSGDLVQDSGVTIDDDDNLFGHGAGILANSDTSLTLTASHNGKVVTLDNGSAITLTLPQLSTETLATGFQCVLIQKGAGQVSVVKEGSDTILSKDSNLKLTGQASVATVIMLSSGSPNAWFLAGDLSA